MQEDIISSLHDAVILQILSFLDKHELCYCQHISSRFSKLTASDLLWKRFFITKQITTFYPLSSSSHIYDTLTAKQKCKEKDKLEKNWKAGKYLHWTPLSDESICGVHFSGDSFIIGIGNKVEVYKAQDTNPTHVLLHDESVSVLKFNPFSNILVSGSDDTTLCSWDITEGRKLNTFKKHSDFVLTADWRNDTLVSGSCDKSLIVWNFNTGEVIHEITAHEAYVTKVTLMPGCDRVISSGDDSRTLLWDISDKSTFKCLATFNGLVADHLVNFETLFVSAVDAPSISMYDIPTAKLLQNFPYNASFMACNGEHLIVNHKRGSISMLDPRQKNALAIDWNIDGSSVCARFIQNRIVVGTFSGYVNAFDIRVITNSSKMPYGRDTLLCENTKLSTVWSVDFDDRFIAATCSGGVSVFDFA